MRMSYVATAIRIVHPQTQYDGCELDVKLEFVASRTVRDDAELELAGWVSRHPPATDTELRLSIDALNEYGDFVGRTTYKPVTTITVEQTDTSEGDT